MRTILGISIFWFGFLVAPTNAFPSVLPLQALAQYAKKNHLSALSSAINHNAVSINQPVGSLLIPQVMPGNEDFTTSDYLSQPIELYDEVQPEPIVSYDEFQQETIKSYDELQPETIEFFDGLQPTSFGSYDEFQLTPEATSDLSYWDDVKQYPTEAEEIMPSSFYESQNLQYSIPLEEQILSIENFLYGLQPASLEDRLRQEDLLQNSIMEQYVSPEDINTAYTSLDYIHDSFGTEPLDDEYEVDYPSYDPDTQDTEIQWPFVDSKLYETTPGMWDNEWQADSSYLENSDYLWSNVDDSLYASKAEDSLDGFPLWYSPDPDLESYSSLDTLSTAFSLPSIVSTLRDIEALIISEELSKTLLLPNPIMEDFGLQDSNSEYLWANGGDAISNPDAETFEQKTTSDWDWPSDKEDNNNFETATAVDYVYPSEEDAESVKSLVETEEELKMEEPEVNVDVLKPDDISQVEEEPDNEEEEPDNKEEEPDDEEEESDNKEEEPDIEEEDHDSVEEKSENDEMVEPNEKMQVQGGSTSDSGGVKSNEKSETEGEAESHENNVKSVEEPETEEETESKADQEKPDDKKQTEMEDSTEADDDSNDDEENTEEDNSPASEESSETAEDSSESKPDDDSQESDEETETEKIIGTNKLSMPTLSFKVGFNDDDGIEDSADE